MNQLLKSNKMASFSAEAIEQLLRKRLGGKVAGTDTNGDDYDSIAELWDYVFHAQTSTQKNMKRRKKTKDIVEGDENANQWYSKAFEYWESSANCPIYDGK